MNWTLLVEDFFCKQHLAVLAWQQAAAAAFAALASNFKHETLGIGGTLLSLGGIIMIMLLSVVRVVCQLVVHVVVVVVVVVVVESKLLNYESLNLNWLMSALLLQLLLLLF